MALSKNLDQFVLHYVEGLDGQKEKIRGYNAAVYEVRLNGVPCIAKRLHDTLDDVLVGRRQETRMNQEDRRAAIGRFREECVLLSGLRHPNIVQMLGVHCGGGDETDISLIMEYMHMDLEHCMKTYPHIPLSYKTSILRDVAYGLAYLHSCNIMHRDINTRNILLTDSLKAKIADFGVAKLFNRETAMMGQTICPGAQDYMPPECFVKSPRYDESLDIFSFGHLTIYLVNQKAPIKTNRTVTVADFRNNQIQVGKRRRALDQMIYQLGGSRHPLYSTVVQCLSDTPDQRPTSRDLVKRMEEMHPIPHKNLLQTLTVLTENQKFVTMLREELAAKDHQMVALMARMKVTDHELQSKHYELEMLQNELIFNDKQQPEIATTEKEQIQLELQVMTKKWCRQKRENQQLQQELLAPKTTRRDDSQRQTLLPEKRMPTYAASTDSGWGDEPSYYSYDSTQQLQSQLAKVQQESHDKEKQLSRLEDENNDLYMDMVVLEHEHERQQKELNQKDVKKNLLEAEKQQWLLHQRMSRAKDMQISKLQYAIEQMRGKSVRPWPVANIDTGVQADYLAVAPDFLRGVEVYGETVLEVVGDKPQKLEWPGYGFYMEVPDGALATRVTASVGVKVILSGQFKLPENRQLISAIYWISSSKVFLKEVTFNIQHFAIITSEEQCSKFSFIIAKCSQKELPYTFREKTGSFNPHTQYGAIKLKQFSLVGETGSEDTELRYTTLKFYKPIPSTVMVDFIFVVICNHELFLEFIRQEYHSYTEDRQNQMLDFKNDVVVLDLPAAGLIVDGWKIVPLTHPQIAKVDILQFKRGKNLPACSIQLEWTKSGNPSRLFHQVNIIGANKPDDYFYMRYYPQAHAVAQNVTSLSTNITAEKVAATSVTRSSVSSDLMSPLDTKPALVTLSCYKFKDTEGKVQRIHIIDEIAAKWRRVGLSLNFSASDLDNIESSCQGKVEECSERLLIQWLDGNISTQLPISWETLLDALRDARLGKLAETLTDSMIRKAH